MITIEYSIEFHTYWHVSSGLSGATYADTLVNKTREDLPFIPGKTLKGLLREAASEINRFDPELVTTDFINTIFGVTPEIKDGESIKATDVGHAFFSNAQLSAYLTTHIKPEQKALLYRVLASTKIEANGIAEDKTLRQLEVSIPMTLYASIAHFPDNKAYSEQMNYCFKWVKRMGLNRNRGLGRCTLTMI